MLVQRAIWARVWFENEQDMTGNGSAYLERSNLASKLTERGVTSSATQVDKSALGEEDDVSARLHLESVDLGLDLDVLDGVGLQPCNVNLDIEVTDATWVSCRLIDAVVAAYLETMASSCMTSKCLPVMMSRLPVVVTKTLARGAASSMVVTS